MLTKLSFNHSFNGKTCRVELSFYEVLTIASEVLKEHLQIVASSEKYPAFSDSLNQAKPRRLTTFNDFLKTGIDLNNPKKTGNILESYYQIGRNTIRLQHQDRYCADVGIVTQPFNFEITAPYNMQELVACLVKIPNSTLGLILWILQYCLKIYNRDKYLEEIGLVPERIRYEYLQRYFDYRLHNDNSRNADIFIAQTIRKLINGNSDKLPDCALGTPLLTALFFLAEFSRNYFSLYSTLILLDFIEAGLTYGANSKYYSWHNILWHTKQDTADCFDGYGKSRNPGQWGGKHSMTHNGSFADQVKDAQGKVKQFDLSLPLTTSRQKEGGLIIRWLHYQISKSYETLQAKIEQCPLTKNAPALASKFSVTPTLQFEHDQENINLMRYVKIYQQGNIKKLNSKQRRQVEHYLDNVIHVDAVNNVIKPLLRRRLSFVRFM